MKRVIAIARWSVVSVGIIILTSFTIDATDSLRGSTTALSGLVGSFSDTQCPSGTVEYMFTDQTYCVDKYENSVGAECLHTMPQTVLETKENLEHTPCTAVSQSAALPWTAVTYHQAKALCAKRSMRLLTSAEWYKLALGTPHDDRCNIAGSIATAGAQAECVSYRETHDMVGNVWEWVAAEVENGQYRDRILPASGYVMAVAPDGVAAATDSEPQALYDDAYFWSNASGTQVMMRGGYYDSRSDASIYTTHAGVAADFHSPAIGFRCITEM